MNKYGYGETICPLCEKPYATDEDYDKYEEGEGEHLCWNTCMFGRESTRDKLIEVLEERDEMAYRFSCLLEHATGGMMSKTNYTKEAMYDEVDDYVQRLIEQACEECELYAASKGNDQ